ncbi:coiled-coil domain-containing protein [Pseudomonas huaxiensis]|uniref:hypothetical protein n=1 Tax=Pseudomonas huaxiensis TaxID=2213017 RepID=UPI000DA65153|nr:hypothetical protein [Pseudomonas huaxiensis]
MYRNNHASRLVALKSEAERITSSIDHLQTDLRWFEGFDNAASHSRLAQLNRDTGSAREQLELLEKSVRTSKSELQQAREKAAAGWSPAHWISTERSVAKRQVTTLEGRLKQFQRTQAAVASELSENERQAQGLSAQLQRYRDFDPLQAQAVSGQLNDELQRLRETTERTYRESEHWEAKAGEVFRHWSHITQQLRGLEQDIIDAECFIYELDNAQSAKDRAIIHSQCEQRFGGGKGRPGPVLREAQMTQRRLQRDEEKLNRRLRDITRLLDKQIRGLVLDSNNLCYVDDKDGKQRFIGLAALGALVPELCASYEVTLVFDASITRLTGKDEKALQTVFPGTRVLIAPNKTDADDAVLGAAEFDQNVFAISRDRYADYPDRAAVREERVLRPIVHPDSVQIPQLEVQQRY